LDNTSFTIRFEDDEYWYYPIELAHRALLSVGDKVKIPKTKSVGESIESSGSIICAKSVGQDYLYYTGEEDGVLILRNVFEEGEGDFFALADIELYTEEKENNMKTIKKSELKKIHDVACSAWQSKLTALTIRNPWGDDIELSQEEVSEMFAAATSVQKVVLEEVFGKQDKEINLISEDINHTVDGLPVFGVASMNAKDALIGLPKVYKDIFYLNPDYDWKLYGTTLKVTRK
jgi:hypothetical protein